MTKMCTDIMTEFSVCNDIFVQSYRELFTDHLACALDGGTVLYRVTDAGYEPIPMEAVQ